MWRWTIAVAPLAFLGLFVFAIRRKWTSTIVFALGFAHGLPIWLVLRLASVFTHRTEFQAPLLGAMVVSSLGNAAVLLSGDRLKSWAGAGQVSIKSFRYPLSLAMGFTLFLGFGLAALQFPPATRAKALIAFGLTAAAISAACFLFERSNQRTEAKADRMVG